MASAPYAWPFAGDLAGERLAVVVTGVQPWFTKRCPGWPAALEVVTEVVGAARRIGGLVVWVTHGVAPRAAQVSRKALGAGRPGVLPVWNTGPAVLAVAPESGDVVVAAGGIDGFWASPLDDVLRSAGRDLLVLSGAGYETTVHSTLRSANDRGYECLTLTDGSAPGQPELAGAATSSICMSGGIFGAVAPSAALITTLSTKESKCLFPS